MPANLSPDYKRAEQAYRAAEDDRARLDCLKEMLRAIPKHKGTEHLQADLKSRIKQLTDELVAPRKGAARTGPLHSVRREGAAQIAMLGPPNSGKSSLHVKLTGSRAVVAPYPHSTHEPLPGMLAFEDVNFQLIDLPPITADYIDSWYVNALQPADAALLVVDLTEPDCTESMAALLQRLEERRVSLVAEWPASAEQGLQAEPVHGNDEGRADAVADPFRIRLPTLLIANKADRHFDSADLDVLKELLGIPFPSLVVSADTGDGLDAIGTYLFRELGVVRVYTKTPGKPPEMDRPFTVQRGATVLDVARLVHKEIAETLKYARAWGTGVYDGQQVGPEHRVADKDVVELH